MSEQIVDIDPNAGFCFGVVTAIGKAEEVLASGQTLYCLGDIVHNEQEVARLAALGLQVIDHASLKSLRGAKVLLRAHGEPPSTYETAAASGIEIVDATCPVVLMLQRKIRRAYLDNPNRQIVIYGKAGHAEVNGLVGQTDGTAIVVEHETDISEVDLHRDMAVFSQTTKSAEGFEALCQRLRSQVSDGVTVECSDTICRRVSNRMAQMTAFAKQHDVVIFVCGRKSSNGQVLFEECRKVNPRTYQVAEVADVRAEWLEGAHVIGVSGATSTPKWQMQEVKDKVIQLIQYGKD
ncbi:MAG: 4-hydroxy-3-methylbut-2-enyl diphosphate reductase [Paludibacteraceae bacterium]|nr:4-hydroxy-3-methylbut-2-enyl diphosphate reductase [Paludibacteraceae bacterium]